MTTSPNSLTKFRQWILWSRSGLCAIPVLSGKPGLHEIVQFVLGRQIALQLPPGQVRQRLQGSTVIVWYLQQQFSVPAGWPGCARHVRGEAGGGGHERVQPAGEADTPAPCSSHLHAEQRWRTVQYRQQQCGALPSLSSVPTATNSLTMFSFACKKKQRRVSMSQSRCWATCCSAARLPRVRHSSLSPQK